MLIIEKILRFIFVWFGGNLLMVSIEICFFRLLKKITAEYFTKFTNASYENIFV